MHKIFWWATALVIIIYWLTLADKQARVNDNYWSGKVEQCSKVGGFMNSNGECEQIN